MLIGMKHDWISDGAEGRIRRHRCENCNWEREQSKDQVWYRRAIGTYEKRHWLVRWWSSATTMVHWSNTEPPCDGEEKGHTLAAGERVHQRVAH